MSVLNFKNEVKTATIVLKPHAMKLTRDINDAEDLIQETIVRALINEDKFQEGTNIRAWLFTIMKNIFINDYRKKSKRNTVIDTTENLKPELQTAIHKAVASWSKASVDTN